MKIVTDFFNKTAILIDKTYFPNVKFYRDNENCMKAHYCIENFNNGVLPYTELVAELAKLCNDTQANIHNLIKEYVIFDSPTFLKMIEKKFGNSK